jgi:hypothetical protein
VAHGMIRTRQDHVVSAFQEESTLTRPIASVREILEHWAN